MAVNLLPHSGQPCWVEDSEYEALVRRKGRGWSECADEQEWLAKLHYLRTGHRAGKLGDGQFAEREERLVELWLRRHL